MSIVYDFRLFGRHRKSKHLITLRYDVITSHLTQWQVVNGCQTLWICCTLVIAPLCRHGPQQKRSGTWRAPSSVAHTCLIPSQPQPVLIYPPRKVGGLSKPRPGVQRATGPRLQCDRLRPAGLEPRSRDH